MAVLNSSITTQRAREDRAIYRATRVLEGRLRAPGEAMNGTNAVRQFLVLSLAGYEREVFSALWVDAQYRMIAAEHLFAGTLTQTSVYPREVVRRCLHHNAAAVIFAHNHPSGSLRPSDADIELTQVLRRALDLVDVQVLDHFIVAGVEAFSFAENRLLGQVNTTTPDNSLPKKGRNKARAKA